MTDTEKKFYVHYTVNSPASPKIMLLSGPYTSDEAIDQRSASASYPYVTDCYISEDPKND